MKCELDFENKIIKLNDNSINLKEFFDLIKDVLPDWKTWTLLTINQTNLFEPINYPINYPTKIWENPITYLNDKFTYNEINYLDLDLFRLTCENDLR